MKKPDPWKHESWLRRILDAEKFDSIVYFEEAVLADSSSLNAKGYFLFLITETSFHYLQTSKDSALQSATSWLLTDFHAVLRLNDAATFFPDEAVAQHTRHIRCHVSDQAASAVAVLDFFSFYEDSTLFHHLHQAWQHAHVRAALPAFYPIERNKLAKLSRLAVQTLYNHLETQLLAAGRDEEEEAALAAEAAAAVAAGAAMGADGGMMTPQKARPDGSGGADEQRTAESEAAVEAARARAKAAALRAKRRRAADNDYWDVRTRTRLVEEMTLCCAAHRSFQAFAFESTSLIPFLLLQLRSLGRLRQYMLPVDPAHTWALIASRQDVLIEDDVDAVRYAVALLNFLARLIGGSESIAARTKLLAWNSTSREAELAQTIDDIFFLGGIPLGPERGAHAAASAAAAESLSPLSPMSPHTTQVRGTQLVTPSQFLDALDAHQASLAARGTRTRLVDEEDRRFTAHYLYNMRAQRKWKEGVLAAHGDALLKEAGGASTSATKAKLASGLAAGGGLHVRDAARIAAAAQADAAALASRRGPPAGRSRRNLAAAAKEEALLPPKGADEVGDEAVLLANDAAERAGLAALAESIPELEVAWMDALFHFVQLLEHVLEAQVPFLTCNLDHLFRHLLLEERARDFASLQVPQLARGLVHLCQKERRAPLSYYCFVYASVLSKCMLRSAELQALLEEQQFLALLAGPTRAAQQAKTLALLPDVQAATLAPNARGLHFYQRCKPLLQHMLELLVNK